MCATENRALRGDSALAMLAIVLQTLFLQQMDIKHRRKVKTI